MDHFNFFFLQTKVTFTCGVFQASTSAILADNTTHNQYWSIGNFILVSQFPHKFKNKTTEQILRRVKFLHTKVDKKFGQCNFHKTLDLMFSSRGLIMYNHLHGTTYACRKSRLCVPFCGVTGLHGLYIAY